MVPPLPGSLKAARSMWLEIPGRNISASKDASSDRHLGPKRYPLGSFSITALLTR